jgi:NADH dehydrogenase
MQGGAHVAKNIQRAIKGLEPLPFVYKDLGNMATIGRRRAVAWLPRLRFSGFFAWVLWLTIHLVSLAGFRNRAVVFFQWAWSYYTWQRSARLIHESDVHAPGGDP